VVELSLCLFEFFWIVLCIFRHGSAVWTGLLQRRLFFKIISDVSDRFKPLSIVGSWTVAILLVIVIKGSPT